MLTLKLLWLKNLLYEIEQLLYQHEIVSSQCIELPPCKQIRVMSQEKRWRGLLTQLFLESQTDNIVFNTK